MRRGRGPERLRLRTSYPIPLPQARGGRSLARRPPPSCTQGSSLSPHSWLKEVPTLSVGATDRVPDPGGDPGPGPGVLWQGGHLHPCRGNLYTGLGGGCTPSEASRDPYTWTRAPKVGLAAQSAAGPRPVPASWPRALTGLATRQCPPGRTLSRPTRSGSERTLLSLEPPTLGKGLLSREHLPRRGCPAPRPPPARPAATPGGHGVHSACSITGPPFPATGQGRGCFPKSWHPDRTALFPAASPRQVPVRGLHLSSAPLPQRSVAVRARDVLRGRGTRTRP